MNLESVKTRKKQGKITAIALITTALAHVLAFYFLNYTEDGTEFKNHILKYLDVAPVPESLPVKPPELNTEIKGPNIDLTKIFNTVGMDNRPEIKDPFDWKTIGTAHSSGGITIGNDEEQGEEFVQKIVSNFHIAPMTIVAKLEIFDDKKRFTEKKAIAVGEGKRTSGKMAITTLDLPGSANSTPPWSDGEMENITEFISRTTSVKVELGARAISFVDNYSSFSNWLDDGKKRGLSQSRALSELEPEVDALDALANSLPLMANNEHERFKNRVKNIVAEYFNVRFNVKLAPQDSGWVKKISEVRQLPEWLEKEYIPEAEKAFLQFYEKKHPTGRELKGFYTFLRMAEMMKLPILFCDPRGVPAAILPENMRLLRTYIDNGGFIYFINTVGIKKSRAIRGIIGHLVGEELKDSRGDSLLVALQSSDKEISGYVFREPTPSIFHPWTFFPMILPRQTDVYITILNVRGDMVFADTLNDMLPGAYLQKNRHYKWHGTDNQGNELESGYYIYQVMADLHKQSMPLRISKLRRLPNGKHKMFSSYFNISEVPTKETVKPEDLPYGESGVFGVSLKGRLCICYTEGYKEKALLGKSNKDAAAEEAALKWVTNVVFQMLQDGSLAR